MPVQVLRALYRGMEHVLSEGLERRWRRHEESARRARVRLAELGFDPVFPEEWASPTVLAMLGRPDLDADSVVSQLAERHGIRISRGMGPFEGRVFRIGNMAVQASEACLNALATALREIISSNAREISDRTP
jgi:alanine-glyoxylate transaminase/serine-glyoxylate transaminase/serine-pyruvate transaminase